MPPVNFVIPELLKALAEAVATWIDDVPGVPGVYLFGSRVRGDHRPESDVDLAVFPDEMAADRATTEWWTQQNLDDFEELKARLPGPLKISRDPFDEAREVVKINRGQPVFIVRKAICVWTPPKL